uniref:Uncharacterized protein n=1 Tax=Geobacter sp. (strain M21) TaxID=443144 RepID=C6E1D7_GEOSM
MIYNNYLAMQFIREVHDETLTKEMRDVASFGFNEADHAVFAYLGCLPLAEVRYQERKR